MKGSPEGTESEESIKNHVYDFLLQNRSDIMKQDSKAKASVGPTKERISFIHIQTPLNKTKAVFIDD